MIFSNEIYNSERLIPPATEPANKHWLMLQTLRMYMAQVERDFPEWFAQYEDADALIFDADTALDLSMTAPSEFTAGLLVGRFLVLQALATMGMQSASPEPV